MGVIEFVIVNSFSLFIFSIQTNRRNGSHSISFTHSCSHAILLTNTNTNIHRFFMSYVMSNLTSLTYLFQNVFIYSNSFQMRVSSKFGSTAGVIKHKPQFVSKRPPISNSIRWILLAIGTLATIYDGQFYATLPKPELTELTENSINLGLQMTQGGNASRRAI